MKRSLLNCELPLSFKVGLTGILGAVLLGLWASMAHMQEHHGGRDGEDGLTFEDIRGVYHGIEAESPLLASLTSGHPKGLSDEDRKILVDWLQGDGVTEGYDDFDLGDQAPAEVIDRACLTCHSRSAGDAGAGTPLEYWDDIARIAFSKRVAPTSPEIVLVSLHTHALGMAPLAVLLLLLGAWTRWPRWIPGLASMAMGVGLVVDLGAWLLARETPAFLWCIVSGGAAYMGGAVLLVLLVLLDLWWPQAQDPWADQ